MSKQLQTHWKRTETNNSSEWKKLEKLWVHKKILNKPLFLLIHDQPNKSNIATTTIFCYWMSPISATWKSIVSLRASLQFATFNRPTWTSSRTLLLQYLYTTNISCFLANSDGNTNNIHETNLFLLFKIFECTNKQANIKCFFLCV